MKPKPQEKISKDSCRAKPGHWHEMNRKQRRETMRKIQSDDLSLEVYIPMPPALISVTNPTTWLYLRRGTANRYVASDAPQRS